MVTSRKPLSGSYVRFAVVRMLVLLAALLAASTAQAAVSISRAELSGTQLRIEGQARANSTITVDGVAMGTSATVAASSGSRGAASRRPATAP